MIHRFALDYHFLQSIGFCHNFFKGPHFLILLILNNCQVSVSFRIVPSDELMVGLNLPLLQIRFSQSHYSLLLAIDQCQKIGCFGEVEFDGFEIFAFGKSETSNYFLLWEKMKNFIKFNIDNVKGKPRASSLIEQDTRKASPTKPKFNVNPRRQYPYNQQTMPQKIRRLEGELSTMHQSQHQSHQIMEEIHQIKQDIKMIKSYIFNQRTRPQARKNSEERYDDDEQNMIFTRNKRFRSQGSQAEESRPRQNSQGSSPPKRVYKLQQILEQKLQRSGAGISLKSVFTAVKDYKIEGPEFGTIFYGFAKRNSQAVALKYFENRMDHVIEVYDRLWKNIAKAEWPCINRIYDYKSDETNFLVMEKNRSNIVGLPYRNILTDIVKIMEFIHDCGYLYRNIQPEHFMLNDEGQLVIIDFKRAKRYIDIRGHAIEVADSIYTGSPFASNNQVRCMPECRKDDLESVGYLALLLLQMEIPWAGMNRDQVVRIRSGLTLQQLYKGEPKWVYYMAYVMRLPRHQRPDYKYLIDVISRS